jgi:hypothetical protein
MKADLYRKTLLEGILHEGVQKNNRLNITRNNGGGFYHEIITLDEIRTATKDFTTHQNTSSFLNELVFERIAPIISEYGLSVNESEFDAMASDCYDGYELNIPIIEENYNHIEELFNEVDQELNPDLKNRASQTPLTREPHSVKTPHIPVHAKKEKTQNPKQVDLVLKSTFQSKFNGYRLKSDVGEWKAIKFMGDENGKLIITWESKRQPTMLIETLFFPNDTNKIRVQLKNRKGEVSLETFFEIYRIPTDEYVSEKFFRKTVFSLLKKYIDTNVIQISPFREEFTFWKTDNPNFSYSFSTPNKNRIILDLINFISTAQKPILDDFFEQNNLKHKQGYLQTLLDSAEAAGIFQFKREGNEILILRGPSYKAFLEGKVRRVLS